MKAVCNATLSGREVSFPRGGDLTGGIPDQPVLVSLVLMVGLQIPTKSHVSLLIKVINE